MSFLKTLLAMVCFPAWIVIGASGQSGNASPDSAIQKWDTVRTWENIDLMAADHLDQFYLVKGMSLLKFNSAGDSLFSWSDPENGRIRLLDVTDPLRILVFHPEFNLIRFLNNRLTPLTNPVSLDDLGITQALGICTSRQGGMWIIDGNSLNIKYFDKQFSLVLESSPILLPPDFGERILNVFEAGDRLYVHVPDREIQVFDLFGNFIRKIPIRSASMEIDGSFFILASGCEITRWQDPVSMPSVLFSITGYDILQACRRRLFLLVRLPEKVILMVPRN